MSRVLEHLNYFLDIVFQLITQFFTANLLRPYAMVLTFLLVFVPIFCGIVKKVF